MSQRLMSVRATETPSNAVRNGLRSSTQRQMMWTSDLSRLLISPARNRWSDAIAPPQTKLIVGSPADALEREADSVSGDVLRPDALVPAEPHPTRIPGGVEGLPFLGGHGRPLPGDAKAYFERRFGFDFGTVRIHTDEHAADAASELGARAFTARGNIVFGRGEFAPGTASGRQLLAHELTHVVQQHGGLQRQVPGGSGDDPSTEPVDETTTPSEGTVTGEEEIDEILGGRDPNMTAGISHTRARQVSAANPGTVQRVCEKPAAAVGYPVRVNLAIPATPAADRSKTTAQISAMAGDPSGRTAGLTRFRTTWRFTGDYRSAGGRTWLTKFSVAFQRASIRLFLTSQFAAGSCELADLARHEQRHDRDFRENAAEAERDVCDVVAGWPSAAHPAALTIPQLKGLISDTTAYKTWQLSYDNWFDGCTWDTVDYPRLYQGCGGGAVSPQATCTPAPVQPAPTHVLPLPQKQP